MGIEDRELRQPLFEVDGHQVLDFKSTDEGNAVTFSFVIQMDEPPTPYNLSFSKLMDTAGAWEILKQKKWMDNLGRGLVPLKQRRECTVDDPGTYKLKFTYIRKDETQLN